MGKDSKRYQKIQKDIERCKKIGKDAKRWGKMVAVLKNAVSRDVANT